MLMTSLIWPVLAGIVLLLALILYFRLHAFIALFLASIAVALCAGMPPSQVVVHLQKGMGDTLGFVAAVVGLGSMFGAILEQSGGAHSLAHALLKRTGERNAPWAMGLTGFLIAIPVFFDVAFIILVPVVYALRKDTGKSLLLFGIPLLAGLAVSHSFIPPTPGPVAVAEIIGADLGLVIVTGIIAGLPAAIIGGPVFASYIAKKIQGNPPVDVSTDGFHGELPSAGLIILITAVPVVLIVITTVLAGPAASALALPAAVREWLIFAGHPFTALIIANLIAWYFLGIRKGYSGEKLLTITGNSLAPAGVIILVTGAGGMFKQVLTGTGAGKMLAEAISGTGISFPLFAFLVSALVRVLQGSATVAMITAAGMTASLTSGMPLNELEKALIVTSIACGATILSHVNDSGFWLVSRYFGLNEKETFASWSVTTTLIAITGLAVVLLIHMLFV